jgi:raffinose/stachyose/melibiose transport system substrate-binding protein
VNATKLTRASVLVAVAALGLGGCSAASGSDSADGGAVTIWLDDNTVNPCFAETLAATYENDEVEIDVELKTDWDSLTKTAVAGGGGPDIIMTPGISYTVEYAKAGALAPLDEYADRFGWDETIAPWALEAGVYEDSLFSLQSELETMILWYNTTVFDELGLTAPTTTTELAEVADALDAAGVIPFASGNAEWKGVNEWAVSGLFNGHAGADEVHAALSGDASFTDEGFVESIELIDEWQKNGYFAGGLDRYYTNTFDQYLSSFGAGEAGMNIEGSWRFENIDSFFEPAGNEWDWVPFPTEDGSELYSIGTGSSWAINAASDNKDAAADVLSHIFDPEVQAQLAVDCGFAPGPVAVEESMLEGLDPRQARLYASVAAAAEEGDYGYLTWAFFGPKTDKYIYEEIEKVWGGSLSVEDYLAGLQALNEEEQAGGDLPPLPPRDVQ